MDSRQLISGNKYILQHGSRRVKTVEMGYKTDVNTLARKLLPVEAGLNDVMKSTINKAEPLSFNACLIQ